MSTLQLLILLTICNHLVFTGGRVAISLYAIQLGATPFAVGVMMSLSAALPMLFAVSAGRMVDRVGGRAPMLWASVALALSTAVPFVWPAAAALFLVSALMGASFMLYHVAIQNMAGYLGKPEDRAITFNMVSLGFSASAFIGPMLAGFAIDAAGHALAFLMLSAFPLAPIVVLALNKIRLPRPHRAQRPNPDRRVMDLLRNREMRRVFIFSGLQAMAWDLFTFAIPIYGTAAGFSASTIGLILGAFAGATFTIRLLLPLFARRVSPWSVMSASLLVAGVAFTCFPLFSSAGMMMAAAFVLGLGLGASQPMVLSLMHSTAPEGRVGEAIGIRTTIINMSMTGMPLAFGALGSVLGMAPVFWTSALLMFWGGYFARKGRTGRDDRGDQ